MYHQCLCYILILIQIILLFIVILIQCFNISIIDMIFIRLIHILVSRLLSLLLIVWGLVLFWLLLIFRIWRLAKWLKLGVNGLVMGLLLPLSMCRMAIIILGLRLRVWAMDKCLGPLWSLQGLSMARAICYRICTILTGI